MREHTRTKSGIRRAPRPTANFTTIANAVINDDRLSFRARGVLMWLLSKPADWRTRSLSIAEQSPIEGRDAIRAAMRELEALGYLTRERVRDELGRWSIIHTIHERPVDGSNQQVTPEPGNPDSGRPDPGEPGATQRTDRPRTETNNPPRKPVASPTQRPPERLGVVVSKHAHGRFDSLAAACRERGLIARWDALKPEQVDAIAALIDAHGVDKLVKAAHDAHRPSNPTRYAQGWIGAWSTLPLPRQAAINTWTSCGNCDEGGWVLDPHNEFDAVIRCSCRQAVAA